MYEYPPAVERLMESLMRLPTVGPKTAGRLAFHLLSAPPSQVEEMIASLQAIRDQVKACRDCGNYSQDELCRICCSDRRDRKTLCVVGQAKDVAAFERTGEFRGLYHVLGGLISPMDGRGPEQLRIKELEERVRDQGFEEVVLATDPTVAGDATALYLEEILSHYSVDVSRLATGIPIGSEFEYTDEVTLGRALSFRSKVSRS